MRRLAVATLVAALALPGSAAAAATLDVGMSFNRYNPRDLDVLTGDTVVWRNHDRENHNVTSTFGSGPLASGEIVPGASWSYIFGSPGRFAYRCTNHAGMVGSVTVANVHLDGPAKTLNHGNAARFTGLAQANQEVVLHRADGSVLGTATAGGDRRFSFTVSAALPGNYYAVSGGLRSANVRVRVKPKLAITSRRAGKRVVVVVSAQPSQAGARVVLERLQRSRWMRVTGGRLNASSKATFRVARKPMKLRARTTSAVRGYEKATSRAVRVR